MIDDVINICPAAFGKPRVGQVARIISRNSFRQILGWFNAGAQVKATRVEASVSLVDSLRQLIAVLIHAYTSLAKQIEE
jgi:non-ribosomal peptide synthetase component F